MVSDIANPFQARLLRMLARQTGPEQALLLHLDRGAFCAPPETSGTVIRLPARERGRKRP
jgi:hypothetical protein